MPDRNLGRGATGAKPPTEQPASCVLGPSDSTGAPLADRSAAKPSQFTLTSLEGRFSELAIAANQVLIGLRPIKSNGEYVNRFYGREIERLDALVKEVLADAK